MTWLTIELSRAQKIFLMTCLVLWVALAFYVPQSASIDVYFFRDAACNWVQGHGFRTASLEKSVSFVPVLDSNYTPLAAWVFIPFAKVFGCGFLAATLDSVALGAVGGLMALAAGLRVTAGRWQRWALVILTGAAVPYGFFLSEADRPEQVTFVLLVLLLWVLGRTRQTVFNYAGQGVLAGLAFLSQPFGGVLAVLFIAGTAFARAFFADRQEARAGASSETGLQAARRFLIHGTVAALFFAAPIGITVAAFQHQDPHALARFLRHARLAGTHRVADYSMSADNNAKEALEPLPSLKTKLKMGVRAQMAKGPSADIVFLGWGVTILLCILLALRSGGLRRNWPVWAVLSVGFLVPRLSFPIQENYHLLGGAVVPIALALGWCGYRVTTGRQRTLLWAMFALQLLILVPNMLLQVISRIDARASAMEAIQQARFTAGYMRDHGLGDSVLMVPFADYFLYKPFHGNIYNPNYFAHVEGLSAIGGVAACKTGSHDFSRAPEPVGFPGNWTLISRDDTPLRVTLFGHAIMHRNWTLGCDVYVRSGATGR
jgi:hypothetical protein